MKSIMIIGIIFLLGFTIIGIAVWRKVRTPKTVTPTATAPTPATTPATPKKPFNWTWLKWVAIIGVIIFVI